MKEGLLQYALALYSLQNTSERHFAVGGDVWRKSILESGNLRSGLQNSFRGSRSALLFEKNYLFRVKALSVFLLTLIYCFISSEYFRLGILQYADL